MLVMSAELAYCMRVIPSAMAIARIDNPTIARYFVKRL
jgi:hypothetical protein